MSNVKSLSLLVALAAITLSAPLSAQSKSTVSSTTLDAAVAAPSATNRSVVTGALTSSEAITAAGKMGVSAEQLSARVAALDDAAINQYADQIRAGGANVIISTTAIIIGLLILILLIK